MASTFTTNKNIEKPASGDYNNAWAAPVNADWDDIDTAFGGNTSISTTGLGSGTTLSIAQYRPPNIVFIGTIGAALTFTIPTTVGGIWSVFNDTVGNFPLSVGIAGGNSLVMAQGQRSFLVSDGTLLSYAAGPPVMTAHVVSATPRTLTQVPSNDTYLTQFLGPGTYEFVVSIGFATAVNAGFSGNVNFSGSFTSGSAIAYGAFGANANAGTVFATVAAVQATQTPQILLIAGGSNTGPQAVVITGSITVTGAGVFGFAWAQATSNVGATTLGIGSYLKITSVG